MGVISGLDEGWLYIFKNDHSSYMKVLVNGKVTYDEKGDPTIEPLPSNYRYGYNLQYFERPITISDVFFISYEDFEAFRINLVTWNSSKLYLTVVNKKNLVTGTTTTYNETSEYIEETGKTFITSGVKAGDIIEMTSGADSGNEYLIQTVDSETKITVFGNLTHSASETVTYKIHRGTMIDSYAGKRYVTCFYIDAKGHEKEFGGEGDVWKIGKLLFDQA